MHSESNGAVQQVIFSDSTSAKRQSALPKEAISVLDNICNHCSHAIKPLTDKKMYIEGLMDAFKDGKEVWPILQLVNVRCNGEM